MDHRCRIPAVVALLVLGLAPWARAQARPDPEATFNAGLMHLREGRTEQAIEAFRSAIKQDSKNPYFYKGLGVAYLSLNQHKNAVEAFRKALELNPYYVDVRNDLGTALILAGRREEGKKEILAAFNDPMNPTPEISARNLGQAYLDEKRYAEALNWCQTSVSRNKSYPDAHLCVADIFVAAGRLDDAVAGLELAVKTIPDEPSVVLALGQAYYRSGRFSEAREKLEQVAGKDPAGPFGRRAAELLKNFPK